jgi:hypothetical protein
MHKSSKARARDSYDIRIIYVYPFNLICVDVECGVAAQEGLLLETTRSVSQGPLNIGEV